jgi:arylsulfatase A-like enzyme
MRSCARSVVGFFVAAILFTAIAAAAEKPNIVLIFADDLGWKDAGFQGSDFYETPNIDRLAREGMVFSAGYAAAGNCAPSRACLLSGQYTPRHDVYAVASTLRGPTNLMRMVPIKNKSGLAAANVTIADALRAAGYATGIFGKWHLEGPDGAPPSAQGFEVTLDKNYGGSGAQTDPKGIFTLTTAACEFLEKNRDRPFFAYVSHHAIHTGLQARQATLEKFKAKKPGSQHDDPLYAACTYDLDDGVGILLARLAELGLEKNTLVVFTSDNGATPQSSQEPLRGAKGAYYEGGIRVPFAARWPGKIAAGSKSDVPVINLDLFPTFLAAAGADVPAGKTLDGESLLPLLTGKGSLKREAIYWHFPGYLDNPVPRGRDPVFRTRPASVIRKGDWKLHLFHEEWQLDGGQERLAANRAVELYNVAEDIGERKDLASLETQKRDELLGDLLKWFAATGAKLPTEKNAAYAPGQQAPATKKKKAASSR